MGHRLCSHLDMLHPDLSSRVQAKQDQQKRTHDAHSRDRSFSIGEKVFVKEFPTGKTWIHHQAAGSSLIPHCLGRWPSNSPAS